MTPMKMHHAHIPIPALLCSFTLVATSLSSSGQSLSLEEVVPAELFSIDGMAKASQIQQGANYSIFVSNANIGALGDADMLALRVNSDGSIPHALRIGDGNYHDVCKEVMQVGKNYYLTGYTRSIDTAVSPAYTAFLIKLDTALNFLWQKNFILPGMDLYANSITQASDGTLLVTGQLYNGLWNSFLMKTDTSGTLLWFKEYALTNRVSFSCVRELPGGDILMSGDAAFGFQHILPAACKVNAQGDPIWGRFFNYPSSIQNSDFFFIRPVFGGDVLLAGKTNVAGAGAEDFFVTRIDTAGAVVWAKTYGGAGIDFPFMAQFDGSANELVMVGHSTSFTSSGTPYGTAMRISPTGDLLGATLLGDTTTQQNITLYHSCRLTSTSRFFYGSRGTPANDLYITATDNALANLCDAYPVSAATTAFSSLTGTFTFTVSAPVPLVSDSALDFGPFAGDSLMCQHALGVDVLNDHERGMRLWPNPGDGDFHVNAPADMHPYVVFACDLSGRVIMQGLWKNADVELPGSLAPGTYVIHVIDRSGRSVSALYQRR